MVSHIHDWTGLAAGILSWEAKSVAGVVRKAALLFGAWWSSAPNAVSWDMGGNTALEQFNATPFGWSRGHKFFAIK